MIDADVCPDCWQLVLEKQELREKLTALREANHMSDATGQALRAFDEFLRAWLGPAALRQCFDHQADDAVRDAITAVTAEHAKRDAVGYAVFAVSGDPDADNGVRYEMVSAMFEHQESAAVALDYCRTKKRSVGVRYVVCKLSDLT